MTNPNPNPLLCIACSKAEKVIANLGASRVDSTLVEFALGMKVRKLLSTYVQLEFISL